MKWIVVCFSLGMCTDVASEYSSYYTEEECMAVENKLNAEKIKINDWSRYKCIENPVRNKEVK